jgi:hypothetical protein
MTAEEERSGASTVLDRDLIVEKLAAYCWANDVHSRAMLEECFVADAVWEGTVCDEHHVGTMRGRGRIVDWLAGFWPHQRDQRRHMVTGFAIEELDSDRALLLSYVLLTSARDGAVTVVTTGWYRARMAREADGWKIVELFGGFDAPFWPGKLERLSERGRRRHGLLDDPAEAR